MTPEPEKAEFAEFEIVQGPEKTARAIPPGLVVRFALMGLIGLALFMILLTIGLVVIVPVVIFIVITRAIASLVSPGPRR